MYEGAFDGADDGRVLGTDEGTFDGADDGRVLGTDEGVGSSSTAFTHVHSPGEQLSTLKPGFLGSSHMRFSAQGTLLQPRHSSPRPGKLVGSRGLDGTDDGRLLGTNEGTFDGADDGRPLGTNKGTFDG